MKPSTAGLFMAIAATILWSTAEVPTRVVISHMTPLQLVAVRFAISGGVLAVGLPRVLRRRNVRLSREFLLLGVGLGVIFTLVGICAAASLQYTGASYIGAIWGTTSLMVMALAAVALKERLTRAKTAGVLMGFAGIAILSMTKPSDTFSLLGVVLAVVAVFGFAVFSIGVKKYAGHYGGLPILTVVFLSGAVMVTPLAVEEGRLELLPALGWNWILVAYLGIFASGLSHLLYFMSLQRIEATQASSFIMLKPPLAVVLAAIILGEPLTMHLLVALVLIVGGLYLVVRDQSRVQLGDI